MWALIYGYFLLFIQELRLTQAPTSLIHAKYDAYTTNLQDVKIMVMRYTEAKLLNISKNEKQKLEEIQKEVSNTGGDVSSSQLIRDGIALLYNYKKEIVERYKPKSIRELINDNGR